MTTSYQGSYPSFFIHIPWKIKLPRKNLGSIWPQSGVRKMARITLAFPKPTRIFPALFASGFPGTSLADIFRGIFQGRIFQGPLCKVE